MPTHCSMRLGGGSVQHEIVRPILGIAASGAPKAVGRAAQNPAIVRPLFLAGVVAVTAIWASKRVHKAATLKLIQMRDLIFRPKRLIFAHLPILLLAACADKSPPPIDNSFCVLYQRLPDPSDAVHLKKRENKLAILNNETTFSAECTGPSGLVNGPR